MYIILKHLLYLLAKPMEILQVVTIKIVELILHFSASAGRIGLLYASWI